ncbi:MAG: penicillin-binding protein 2 [Candidatus Yonathbacteria bacterium]|nr:penicillin-binding protein 2 [Candidatus Yonathbacteria bacterium]
MKNRSLSNIWFINTGVLLIALLLIAKLGYIQIAKGEYYQTKAEAKYLTSSQGTFDRGIIFFEERTGRKISAATVVPDYTLAIDPAKVVDKEDLADKLLAIVAFDRENFITRAGRTNDRYEEIVKHLSGKDIEGIRALKEKSVILGKNKKRFYPGGRVAAQVLGFVGSDGSASATPTGRYGIERYYNETLSRRGQDDSSSFFADLFLKNGAAILFDRGREGDLVTTIEPTVQGFFERLLEEDILKKYNATSTGGIIMNPKTGAIYAMATLPNFDPNNFSKEKDPAVFSNPLVDGVYEMGSIIKPLTMAAGIDAGVVTAGTTYDDKGYRTINTKRISNFDGKARGVVTMQDVLSQSLNTGTIFVEERLGKDRFREYFKSFGIGEETGIDLPNEGVGDIRNLESPRDIEYATASFGQGISMTPIAAIRALAALANGGVLVTPHVVKRTEYGIGPARDFVASQERRVIKKETSEEISRMLTVSTDTTLAGGKLKLENYSVAVKTGTAQLVDAGGYSRTDFLHTFVGYFPSYDPKFIVLLILKNPRGEQYASHTLSGPFMQITKFLLNYYEIPPDR